MFNAFSYNRTWDFHPLGHTHAGRTKKKDSIVMLSFESVNYYM